MFLGNPVVLWGGVIAILTCIYGWLKTRRWDAFIILVSWFALYFIWALVSRPVSFYYYYFPAGMVLSLSLTYLFYSTGMVRARLDEVSFLMLGNWSFYLFFSDQLRDHRSYWPGIYSENVV